MLEEAQGADVQGRSIMVDYVGDKSQKGGRVAGEHFWHHVKLALAFICIGLQKLSGSLFEMVGKLDLTMWADF